MGDRRGGAGAAVGEARGSGGAGSGLLYALLVVSWGLNYVVVRWGLEEAAPLWLAFLRAGAGAIALLFFVGISRRAGGLSRRGRREALLLGIPTTGLFFGLWFSAAVSVPAGQTAVLIYTFPLWVLLLSAVRLRYLPAAAELVAVGAGFAGVVLVSQPWTGGAGSISPVALVELLGGAVAWAVGTVLFKERFHGPEVVEANLYQLVGGAATLLIASLWLERSRVPAYSLALLAEVAWLGLVGTALAYTIWYYLLDRYRAETISAYTFLVPIAALAASIPLLGESLDPVQGLGVLLVLSSLYVTGRAARRRSAEERTRPPSAAPPAGGWG